MAVKVTRKLSKRCVDDADYDNIAREMGLDPYQARKADKRLIVWDGQLPGYGLSLTAKGSKSFVWFHKVNGKSRKLTIGSVNQINANRARELVHEAMQSVRDGGDPTQDAKQEAMVVLTVADAFEMFMADPKKDGSTRSEQTIYSYRKAYDRFVAPVIGSKPIADIDQAACNRVLAAALAGYSDAARTAQHNRTRAILKALLNWAWHREMIAAVPRMGRRYAEVKRTPSATRADIGILATALDAYETDNAHRPYVAAIIRMLIYTGARCGEVLGLRWDDIDAETQEILVRKYKGSTHANAKPRMLVITPAVAKLLAQAKTWQRPGNPYVFPGQRTGHYKALRKDWVVFRKQYLGGRDLRLHDLRHIAASAALNEGGMSTEAVGSVLGHKNHQTTERYVRVQTDAHHRAAHRLSETLEDLMGGT